jgi:hypothetical protein
MILPTGIRGRSCPSGRPEGPAATYATGTAATRKARGIGAFLTPSREGAKGRASGRCRRRTTAAHDLPSRVRRGIAAFGGRETSRGRGGSGSSLPKAAADSGRCHGLLKAPMARRTPKWRPPLTPAASTCSRLPLEQQQQPEAGLDEVTNEDELGESECWNDIHAASQAHRPAPAQALQRVARLMPRRGGFMWRSSRLCRNALADDLPVRLERVEILVAELRGDLEADVEQLADVRVVAGLPGSWVTAAANCSPLQPATSSARSGSCAKSMSMTVA